MAELKRILVAVDLSECSRAALAAALGLAGRVGAPSIDVLYVAELPDWRSEPRVASSSGATTSLRDFAVNEARTELDGFLEGFSEEERARFQLIVEAGKPRERILERAKQYDLLVMGTHGRTGRPHSMAGSMTESIVRMAPCPVLSVREPD